jgi:hypothetical protein
MAELSDCEHEYNSTRGGGIQQLRVPLPLCGHLDRLCSVCSTVWRKSPELRIKPSWISAVLTNCRDTRIPPISGLSLLHVLNEEVQGCAQGPYELEAPGFSGYFTYSAHYSNLAPIYLAQRHADLCVRSLHSTVSTRAKCIGQWMRDRSGQRMIGLRVIGLHVKALLLRRRFRKRKAQGSHSYKQAFF